MKLNSENFHFSSLPLNTEFKIDENIYSKIAITNPICLITFRSSLSYIRKDADMKLKQLDNFAGLPVRYGLEDSTLKASFSIWVDAKPKLTTMNLLLNMYLSNFKAVKSLCETEGMEN